MPPSLGWLPERSVAAVARVMSDLGVRGAGPPVLSPYGGGDAAPWRRGTAVAGPLVVKFAWSAPAAAKLWHECQVMAHLVTHGLHRWLPEIEAIGSDPVVLVTRRRPGAPIWYPEVSAMDARQTERLASQLVDFLTALHADDLLASLRGALAELPEPQPQATTGALRDRLPRYIDGRRTELVRRWCDWADAVLGPAGAVLLHGDFAGHNWLWDAQREHLTTVVDFEEAAAGDPHYDLRYLPSQADSLRLLAEVARRYETSTGRGVFMERVMAWHLRTSLGDALWRSEAGVALPFGGSPTEWVDEFAHRLVEAGLDV